MREKKTAAPKQWYLLFQEKRQEVRRLEEEICNLQSPRSRTGDKRHGRDYFFLKCHTGKRRPCN